jgi:hypothetical protein
MWPNGVSHLRDKDTYTRFSSSYTVYFLLNLIYFGMPLQDRTNEFLACVESIRTRSSLPAKHPGKQRQARADSRTDFTRLASAIGKDISGTTVKLGKLAQCGLIRSSIFA